MSAVFGIFNKNGRPVTPDVMMLMSLALSHRGPDGSGIIVHGRIGLGHRMFHTTPESIGETLPFQDEKSNLMITGDIRIDNREALCSAFNLPIAHPDVKDSHLVLKAYEKWGEQMTDHMEGDYVIIIWDPKIEKLLIVSSPSGTRPLYYFDSSDIFVFATEKKALFATPYVDAQINKKYLAMSLAFPVTRFALPETTFFEHISALTAATVLTVSSTGSSSKVYWQPDTRLRLQFKDEHEWKEIFDELFSAVVKAQLRSAFPVASLLSGGLDSSCVTAFAGKLLNEKGKRLQTFSAVLPDNYSGSGVDESHYVNMFKGYPNLDIHYITEPWRGPLDDLHRLIRGGETPFYTSRHFLYTAFVNAAEKKGIRTILDGCFGESGPSFHGDGCLAGQIIKGKCLATAKEIYLMKKRENRSLKSLIKGEIIKPILPFWLQRKIGAGFDLSITNINMPIKKTFIAEWVSHTELKALEKQYFKLLYTSVNHRKNQGRIFQIKKACVDQSQHVDFEKAVFLFPFADRRIIEFCLASPSWIKVKNGYKRYMVRKGMSGLAPEGIVHRTCKQPFSPDFHDRYNRQQSKAVEFIKQIRKDDPVNEIVDIDRLKKELYIKPENNRCDTRNTFITMHVIPRTIYLIHFLKHFADSQ